MLNSHHLRPFLLLLLLLAACNSAGGSGAPGAAPTINPILQPQGSSTTALTTGTEGATVVVDVTQNVRPISPLIYGLSYATREALADLRPTSNSWGGNTSTRYNWEHGTAWNAARDWYYTNVDYTKGMDGSESDRFIEESLAYGAELRVAIPTLGWVARDNSGACSFPNADGSCGDAGMANCREPGPIADPNTTSIRSDVEWVRGWVEHMVDVQGYDVRFFAMDNEPELWGETHYDVHPTCTTYQEILDQYLAYATMVREVAPEAELLGPVTCCWYYYWNSAAGTADKLLNGNQEFLPWFLDQVRAHDEANGTRTIDVLDIHYYPENVFRAGTDDETAARRLRSTRSLWDPSYKDESWIDAPLTLIPRMQQVIAEHYPGLKLGITEWNWGGEDHISGGLAVADVLGIFGREGVYLANYWTYPPAGSPAYQAFKLYTNYDGTGGRFGDTSVAATSDAEQLAAYAALNSADGSLTLMLVNKDLRRELPVSLDLRNLATNGAAMRYSFSQSAPDAIASEPFDLSAGALTLPAGSATLLVIPGQ